jgi:hypothetical protein
MLPFEMVEQSFVTHSIFLDDTDANYWTRFGRPEEAEAYQLRSRGQISYWAETGIPCSVSAHMAPSAINTDALASLTRRSKLLEGSSLKQAGTFVCKTCWWIV